MTILLRAEAQIRLLPGVMDILRFGLAEDWIIQHSTADRHCADCLYGGRGLLALFGSLTAHLGYLATTFLQISDYLDNCCS